MNLIIDVGNTFVKLAVFSKGEMQKHLITSPTKFETDFKTLFKTLVQDFPDIYKGIVSSVGDFEQQQFISDQLGFQCLELNHKLKFPFTNNYTTPKTLGVDRMALATEAIRIYPNNNVLIVDAGTCITYDFVDAAAVYHGGAISPGIRLRYKALHDFTKNLPLLDTKMPNNIVGNSTENAIHSGVVFGVLMEIEGAREDYAKKYSDLTVILTGGDCEFLSNRLKNGIFANSNFLLGGLNFILEFNTQ